MSASLLRTFAGHVARGLAPLTRVFSDLGAFSALMRRLGWRVASLPPAYAQLAPRIQELADVVAALPAEPTLADLATILDLVRAVHDAIGALDIAPTGVDPVAFLAELPERLFEVLIVDQIARGAPTVFQVLRAVGVIQRERIAATANRPSFVRERFVPRELVRVLSDPTSVPRRVWAWGTDDVDFKRLSADLMEILLALGISARIEPIDEDTASRYQRAGVPVTADDPRLRAPLIDTVIDEQTLEVGVAVLPTPAGASMGAGVIVQPYLPRSPEPLQVREHTHLKIDAGTNLEQTLGVWLRSDGIEVRHPFADGPPPLDVHFGVTLDHELADSGFLIGSPSGVHLEAARIETGFAVEGHGGEVEAIARVGLVDLALVLAASDPDSLLSWLLGGETRRIAIPLDIVWSTRTGLQITGGLRVDLPGILELGPVAVSGVVLTATFDAGALALTLRGDATLTLGSFAIRLEGIGVRLVYDADVPGALDAGHLGIEVVAPSAARIALDGSSLDDASSIEVTRFHLDRDCVSVTWREPNLARWLEQLSGERSATALAASELTLRMVFGDAGRVREVRLDCRLGDGGTFGVPWFHVQVPAETLVSIVLGPGDTALDHVAVALTMPASHADDAATQLIAASDFAWQRDQDREIQQDAGSATSDEPLLQLALVMREVVTVVLFDFTIGAGGFPRFLRQLPTALAALADLPPDEPCTITPWPGDGPRPLSADSFSARLRINTKGFTLPFLQHDGGAEEGPQFLQIKESGDVEIDFARSEIIVPLAITLQLGALALETIIDLSFDWEIFAFRVRHDEGLKLLAKTGELVPDKEHLGLGWRFQGVRQPDGRYHYFTLATKDYNYQLLQAPGAAFEVKYRELSEDAIGFAISDFRLTPKGVSLAATVLDRPAKLNGIDTRFRFQDTRLVIVENRISDFTLKGSGPLPPALVGDATADIALQLAQRDGHLTLIAGGAQLKGAKLLDCKATRFQFSVDALGVKFVNEGRFHLYFTLTGSAQFKLAPGDDAEGALALLPNIKIDLVECPLAGDARTIGRHVNFQIELPRPVSFSFLGAFEMELRAIGFVPQAEVFDGDGAMLVTGMLRFAQGAGDVADSRTDLHKLYIGLPKPGGVFPRIHLASLPVHLNLGEVFRLNGAVDFIDSALEKGFTGEGVLTVQGLPTMAASFAFLRVRRDASAPWVRAWFIYVEVRKISFQIPVVSVFLREVGLGFGYRFTLVSLRAADEANDVRKQLAELTKLSRTQGDLSKRDRWAVDLEPEGQDPRWTVALRALISQTSAQASPLRYDEAAERDLACLFLLDAVIALRSDLTFLMAVRGWIFTNYQDYVSDWNGIRNKPPLSGFVLLSPRQKRFLAHAASNPDGLIGPHPPLPAFVQRALSKSQFSATLLVEPSLLHAEMGWPNQLRWADKLGPLQAEFQGGFLFRISRDELVTGTSYLARARLQIAFQASVGIAGIKVSAEAAVAFGARYIGLVSLRDPFGSSALYGGIGIEAMIRFSIEFWIRIKLGFIKIQKTFRFSLSLELTAGLEIGFTGLSPDSVGLRGAGHLAVSVMGRRFSLSANLGLNESAVETALERTRHVLSEGLEATDVEPIPGTTGTGSLRSAARAATPVALVAADGLHAPGYSVFVLRGSGDATSYLVLFPAGEAQGGSEELGFLPPPPDAPRGDDFALAFPDGLGTGVTLEQWVPSGGAGSWVARTGAGFSWRADWDAVIEDAGQDSEGNAVPPFTLAAWLDTAFVVDEAEDGARSYRDPDPIGAAELVADARVHDPTDAAFEAAVRGAVEQFRGSPFFRRDPASVYEQLLERAYRDDTTVYHPSGVLPDDPGERRAVEQQQQAHEARGLIVHDMIADLRDHVAAVRAGSTTATARSVAFAMGLVFRVTGTAPWLADPARRLTLRQRSAPDATGPDSAPVAVATFNVPATEFAANPPRFERIQQLTDARAIGLAWDLVWSTAPTGVTGAQADPEHHLMHYLVRRRALDSNDREVVFTVKGADTLHRESSDDASAPGLLARLVRRFQIVDHFADETAEDLAALPLGGKRYLYSITPVDFSGSAGRPLALVATRFPSEPPLVPVDGECVVHYRVDAATLDPAAALPASTPVLVEPAALTVEWRDPPTPAGTPSVPVATYQLVFRREATVPIGSYGLDSTTQRPATKSLPTTNARGLPTDRKVVLAPSGPSGARRARVALDVLRQAGVLPPSGVYRPESWRVFFQTVSQAGVPSALAPVQLLLRVVAGTQGTYDPLATPPVAREERRPAELEWLPRPMAFPMLPPEDQAAKVGPAHVPMPRGGVAEAFAFGADLGATVGHALDPAGRRCIRFRWNQGPSAQAAYPLELNAGYHLLQLDVDAHTTETFASPVQLAAALRTLQEVQMIPADELALTPSDTLVPAQWEAWYPSAVQRRRDPASRAPGSEIPRAPWYSWRESLLDWPAWPGLTDGAGLRDRAFHPALARLVALLSDPPADAGLAAYRVELQAGPPMQPGDLAALLRATAPAVDPYGWGVLQRLGLSVALRLRTDGPGAPVTGQDLLDALEKVFAFARASVGGPAPETELLAAARHLHVELLFSPGRAISLVPGAAAAADDLLALVQISLRPAIRQTRRYLRIALEGRSGTTVPCVVVLPAFAAASFVDQSDAAAGQADVVAGAEPTAFTRRVHLPLGGRTALLVRADAVPAVRIQLSRPASAGFDAAFAPTLRQVAPGGIPHIEVAPFAPPVGVARRDEIAALLDPADRGLADVLGQLHVERVAATDEAAASFVMAPAALASDLVSGAARASWDALRRYLEALSSTDADVPPERRISVPTTREAVAQVVPDFVAWSQRFFDAAGPIAPGREDPERDATAEGGPWVATAYVRAGSPAHAAPDASGRLTHDQLVEDPWAHAYRFYLRPYGRYDRLWQSLRQSTVLFPGTPLLPDAAPDVAAGGLDVVLARTRPIAAPVVLSSQRLDAPSTPASPAAPGPTWEVILAEHPEQTLADHNATLARQLAFRQLAYTVLRAFAYPDWVAQLSARIGADLAIEPVVDVEADLPGSYPSAPPHLRLPPPALAGDDARTLDLPLRMGPFQQGALALQWEGLPFFYEHRLLAVAQTTTTVSPVNQIVQRDFAYVTPAPIADVEPVALEGHGDPVRARSVRLTLRKLGDALPAAARTRWPAEVPDGVHRTPGWLPDLGVVYQLVESFGGNVEVQAEVLWDEVEGRFVRRQLGKRARCELDALVPPPADTAGDFTQAVVVQPIARRELSRAYDAAALQLPAATAGKLAFEAKVLAFTGVVTHADRAALAAALDAVDAPIIDELHDASYAEEPLSGAIDIPAALADVLDQPAPVDTRLVWNGAMSADERAELLALPGDDAFRDALARLAAVVGAGAGVVSVVVPLGLEMPAADDLGALADKLLIGRARLRSHGLLTRAAVALVVAGLARASDRRAVARLYERALAAGMRGRALMVRTRRGSAPPAPLTPMALLLPTVD